MTLIGAILKKVRSTESVSSKYVSPPPEIEEIVAPKKKKIIDKYAHIHKSVDASAPHYTPAMHRMLFMHRNRLHDLYADNMRLVVAIKKAHFMGKVDDRWNKLPPSNKQYFENRANFLKRMQVDNRQMYKRIVTTGPRVVPTACLRRDWSYNRNEMIRKAEAKFVLFSPVVTEDMEDLAFLAPPGIKRPRVHLTLRVRGCAVMGELVVELFTDVCPDTCRLFMELVDGDGLGYGYVGTKFFSTVRQPNLQSLLSTNELSFELRKILISLIEAGARLAASGRNYEMTLAQLSAALDEPQRTQQIVVQVITPEEIAARFNQREPQIVTDATSSDGDELFKRAAHLQRFLEKFRAWRVKIAEAPNPEAVAALKDLGFSIEDADRALRSTGCNIPAAASWLIGERGSSVFELVNGLPDGLILQTLLKQPQIQRGLLNTRMLIAFIAMVGQTGSASLWLNSPHGSPLLSQISRTYHSEKYCLAVNQFSYENQSSSTPSTSRQRNLFWSGGDVIYDNGFGCYAQRGRAFPVGAENYHFSHSMPGLLSMRVTKDDEMCGIFNITFKPLPQFDLRNEVFGRVIRPCATFNSISSIGTPLGTHPVIEITATRRNKNGYWVHGIPNTRIIDVNRRIITNCL
ncbi:uncharacterized protein Kpc2 [Epargyreus clarus]|uniref:uncharacterized protein Kpc2 n=1 Tax=Epargyreus clarus TaxID=520877 RepID=UPI003C2D99EF